MIASPTLSDLIHLADQALTSDLPPPEFLALVEDYCARFETWYASSGGEVDEAERAECEALQEKHTAVLERAEQLLKDISQDIVKLKARGKGILAYTDTLPKKISVRRTRRG